MKVVLQPLVLVLGSALAGLALAADPWISVPSTPTMEQRLVISGGDLGAYAPVTLRIEHPDGFVGQQVAVADAAGKLRLEYPLGAYGGYSVKAFDANGKFIGGGNLGYFR
jgi:hypothetical protein